MAIWWVASTLLERQWITTREVSRIVTVTKGPRSSAACSASVDGGYLVATDRAAEFGGFGSDVRSGSSADPTAAPALPGLERAPLSPRRAASARP